MKVITLLSQGDLKRKIERALVQDQYVVERSMSPLDCLTFSRLSQYDCAVIDCESFADQEVLTLIKTLRSEKPSMALFVLARHLDLEKRLSFFEAGLDDVISEPFFAAELAVRLKHIIALRRAAKLTDLGTHMLRAGDLQMDLIKRRVTRQSKEIDLRPREFMLLEYLVRNANRSVTRTMILEHVWNSSYEGLTNVVDVHVSALRNKLDRNFTEKLIQTNRGQGYTLVCLKKGVATDTRLAVSKQAHPGPKI
jgi:two-component system, OmpR family, response regulator